MTKINEIYKCNVCGNITEVLHAGPGELVCCGQAMNLQIPKTEDQGNEKHKPIIEMDGKTVTVKVGSIPHPMEEEHHIEWIELLQNNTLLFRKNLKAGEEPVAIFTIDSIENLKARESCNLHGIWSSD